MFKIFEDFDWLIAIPIIILAGFSLALLSVSSENFLSSQLLFFVLGLLLFLIFSQIDFSIYKSLAVFAYLLSIILLSLTFFGPQVRGATRWIEIFGFRWQPAELIKPLMILSFASFFSSHPPRNLKTLSLGLVLLLPPLFLIFRQPDLGNAIIIAGIWLGIVYAGGLPFFLGIGTMIVFFLFLPLGWFLLKSYQKARILSFLNPYLDPGGAGYNSIQAMIAVGSGQFFGRGLGRGPQSHLLFLPEHHTDFIFAALSEELGFVGAGLAIIAYVVLFCRILQIVKNIKNPFASLVLLGIFSQISLQVFINIGMNLGLVPITGITLPLLSYGGSSIISTMIVLGIVVNIGKTITKASRAVDISPSNNI
jgi:rod shape determining protein RodA